MPDEIARYSDNISVADFIEQQSDAEWNEVPRWRASRWGLRAARWFFAAFFAVQCSVALALAALFAARNVRESLRWVGTPLILAGGLTLLLALLLFFGAEFGTWFISDEEMPIGVQEVLEDTARAFSDEVWPPMAGQAGVLILIGFGLWILSFFTPPAGQVSAPTPAEASRKPPPVDDPADAISSQDAGLAESQDNQVAAPGESPPGEAVGLGDSPAPDTDGTQ
jgi:hypothetical protein